MGKVALISDATVAWKYLNGLFSVYKPSDYSVSQVKRTLLLNICRSLNELEPRPVNNYVAIEGPPDDLSVVVRPDYADHPLVVGPRYQAQDVRLSWATKLGSRTSGVLVMGINSGTKQAALFHEARCLRTYRIKGRLGEITDNMFVDGKVVEKAKFEHVERYHLEKVLAKFQASHQRLMFTQCGVDIQSQTGFELAAKGLLRPSSPKTPIIYGFKCIEFKPPDFTIEVMCINEYEVYLLNTIVDIGTRLRTVAVCTGLQCIRQGCFTIEHSLLRRHWNTEHVINSIRQHERVMRDNKFELKHEAFLKRTVDPPVQNSVDLL